MERISAARAMEWSVELEKGLRSKKPGQTIEAILQVGPRLDQWSREPCHTMGALNMFGLVPGQERLFANTILLRLAEAFKSGDKLTRLCVLKVFLFELRHRKKNGKQYNGILARHRVPNHLELLRRVKIVFDTGDFESRAVALCLLGCWADLAKDSASIRYMILLSLRSCHVLEVKAAIFAAGCFSELSEDFAFVFLEILIDMVTSSKISSAVRLVGMRAFAKMGCSSLLASRAYKTGQKLLLDSSKEDIIIVMLVSLSKLASKSVVLISEQKDLLLSFLSQESSFRVKAIALRCLRFLSMGGVCRLPVNAILLQTLFQFLDKADLPLGLHCEVLWMLRKIFQCTLLNLPCMGMPEFDKMVSNVENAAQSPMTSKRLLALSLLVDISCNLRGNLETVSDGDGFSPLPSRVVSLVIDQITLLVKRPCLTDSEVKRECQCLLNFVLSLIKEYPTLGGFALDKIRFLILVNVHDGDMGTKQAGLSVHEFVGFEDARCTFTASKLVPCLYRFAVACLEILDEACAISIQVLNSVKLLVKLINQNSLFDPDICTLYSLLLHSHVIWNSLTYDVDKDLGLSHNDYWVEHKRLTINFTEDMISRRNNWSVYRAGKYAACHGAWLASAFTFKRLMSKVQSDSCFYWLKSLAVLALAESKILLLLYPKQGFQLINELEINEIWSGEVGQDVSWDANLQECGEQLAGAYSDIRSSENFLAAAVTLGQAFYFQRWFLCLRSKVLETVVDILRLLGTSPYNQENIGNYGQVEGSSEAGFPGLAQHIYSLMYFLAQFSFRLKKLAEEFDLVATSFMDLDPKSFKTISLLALNCSLLAFCTGFVLYFPKLPSFKNSIACGMENSERFLRSRLIQDLDERVRHVDCETSTNLKLLLKDIEGPKNCFHSQPRTLIASTGHRERDTLMVCRYAVLGLLRMQEEAKGVNDEGVISQLSRASLQLLPDIVKKLMHIPFQTPKYFFQVRPCIGSELFVFNADTQNPGELSIFQGFHLSLNLCLQLKNAPDLRPDRITELYCILACRVSDCMPGQGGESNGQTQLDFRPWETNKMVNLNEELLWHVKEGIRKSGRKHGRVSDGCDWSVKACVCLKPNERGQGFSNCLLDVSAFPVGSYKINWHSCCLDSQGSYWNLLPLNTDPIFTIKKTPVSG